MSIGVALMTSIFWVFRRVPPARVDHWFRRMQLVSAAGFSLMHGANDAQKTMGIIAGALVTGGYLGMVDGHLPIPLWVEFSAYSAIGLGTLTGGWRIIHTMGGQDYQAAADGRLCRRNWRGGGDLHGDLLWCRSEHDPHDHGCHRRRGCNASALCRPLGCRAPNRLGMAADDSYGSDHRSRALPGHRAQRSPVRWPQGSCHTHKIDDEAPRTTPSSGAVLKAALPWRPGLPTGMAMYCLPSTI